MRYTNPRLLYYYFTMYVLLSQCDDVYFIRYGHNVTMYVLLLQCDDVYFIRYCYDVMMYIVTM